MTTRSGPGTGCICALYREDGIEGLASFGYEDGVCRLRDCDSRFGTFSIPYLFKDRDHANRTLRDPELRALILDMVESKGIVGVNIAAQAESHYFARNPIRKLADFSGKKLRVNATAAERARM